MKHVMCIVKNIQDEEIIYFFNKKATYDLLINCERIRLSIFYSLEHYSSICEFPETFDINRVKGGNFTLYRGIDDVVGVISYYEEIDYIDISKNISLIKNPTYYNSNYYETLDYDSFYFKNFSTIYDITLDYFNDKISNLEVKPNLPVFPLKQVGLNVSFQLYNTHQIDIMIKKGVDCFYIDMNDIESLNLRDFLTAREISEFRKSNSLSVYKNLLQNIGNTLKS